MYTNMHTLASTLTYRYMLTMLMCALTCMHTHMCTDTQVHAHAHIGPGAP